MSVERKGRAGSLPPGLLVVFAVVLFQWVLYLMVGYDRHSGAWTPVHPDTMYTLTVARTWAHGHPLQLLPGDPPSTMLSDLLSPLVLSTGYWLGFRTPSSFVFWSYLMGLMVALLGATFVWRFNRRFVPASVFPATLLTMAFTGVFSNLFHTNFGFFFLFFWGALAHIDSFPRFSGFAILAALTRPEGLLIYLFLVLFYVGIRGRARLWRFLPGVLPVLIPPFVYRFLTGSFVPQGVGPQSILHYQGFWESITFACAGITDQIKGALIGLFSTRTSVGNEGSGWLGTLPPSLFVLALLGLAKYKRWLLGLVGGYLLIVIVGDSFTLFSAAHQNRHINVLAPFFFGFALWFAHGARIKDVSLYVPAVSFFLLMIALQFFGAVSSQSAVKAAIGCDKQIVDHLLAELPETVVLDASNSVTYWADSRLRCHTLSPVSNPYLGAYIRRYFRPLETSELVQGLCPSRVVFVSHHENSLTEQWFSQFTTEQVKSCMHGYKRIAEARLLDLSRISDRAPYGDPLAELDVGDPRSEIECRYRFQHSLERSLGSFLMEGDGFWDGGRPGVVAEEFYLPVPESGGRLVCRYRGSFQGNILEEFDKSPVTLSAIGTRLVITADGSPVFDGDVQLHDEFTHLDVPLERGGMVRFTVAGAVHSFHYWIYPEEAAAEPAPGGRTG